MTANRKKPMLTNMAAIAMVFIALLIAPTQVHAVENSDDLLTITGQAESTVSVSNPRVVPDSSMKARQVATWDCVWFGSYPQTVVTASDAVYDDFKTVSWDANGNAFIDGVKYKRITRVDATDNGAWGSASFKYYKYEPIKWRVLKASGTTAFVIADIALDYQKYNENETSISWETSGIRSWLNGYVASFNEPGIDYSNKGFLSQAFSQDEQSAIQTSHVVNENNKANGTAGGNDTEDKIYLLSESEVYGDSAPSYGFTSDVYIYDEARRCKLSSYTEAMGAQAWNYDYYGYTCPWHLRSPGRDSESSGYVDFYGAVVYFGYDVNSGCAVRPAMNLDLSSPRVTAAGTVSSNGDVDERAATGQLESRGYGTIYNSEGDGTKTEIQLNSSFEDSVFQTASDDYNSNLSYYLCALSRAAYNTSDVSDSLKSLGFNVGGAFSGKPTDDCIADYADDFTTAFSVSKKRLSDDSQLALIVIRGSWGWSWASNALYGAAAQIGLGKHTGFQADADSAYEALAKLLGGLKTEGVKYVITGHSQGAAAANLLATRLYDEGVPSSNVYDYNFACPNVACLLNPNDWNPNGAHDNIFNIGNATDPVTLLPHNSVMKPSLRIPLSTWGKFGKSYWFIPSDDNYSPAGHDMKYYVKALSQREPISAFCTYAQLKVYQSLYDGYRLGRWAISARCPVDVIVVDESGNPIAGVVGGKEQYYETGFGEAIVLVDDDEKCILLPQGRDYEVKLAATGEGEMEYSVYDVDLASEDDPAEKTYESVALAKGKQLLSLIGQDDKADDVPLYVVGDADEKLAVVTEDGKETAISDSPGSEPEQPASIAAAKIILEKTAYTYTGKAIMPAVKSVALGSKILNAITDYKVSYSGNINAGTATVTITGKGSYTGTAKTTFKIAKATNPAKVTANLKTAKLSKVKKKAQTLKLLTVKKAQGKVTFAKVAKGSSRRLTVNKKTGKVTVKKGAKKGAYKIKIKVKVAGNKNYKALTKTVTAKVKVK